MSETPISSDQRDRLVALMRATKAEHLRRLLEVAGANSISEMSSRQAIHVTSSGFSGRGGANKLLCSRFAPCRRPSRRLGDTAAATFLSWP